MSRTCKSAFDLKIRQRDIFIYKDLGNTSSSIFSEIFRPDLMLISKNVLEVNACKNNGKRTGSQIPGILA